LLRFGHGLDRGRKEGVRMSLKFLSFASPCCDTEKQEKLKRIRLGKGSSLVPCFVFESEALLSRSHGNVESVAAHMDLKFCCEAETWESSVCRWLLKR